MELLRLDGGLLEDDALGLEASVDPRVDRVAAALELAQATREPREEGGRHAARLGVDGAEEGGELGRRVLRRDNEPSSPRVRGALGAKRPHRRA